MKITSLEIQNIGAIGHEKILVDKPLIIFYGDIRQGKTTILNSIKWLAGGSIPRDLIRHGEKEAFIEIVLDCGKIRREFYLSKENELKGRKIEAIVNNSILSQKDVALLFNPFLLDQNHFTKMNSTDKGKFLLEIFGVDVSGINTKIKAKEADAKELRTKIKMYGEIDTTEVKKPDLDSLRSKESSIRADLNSQVQKNRETNSKIQKEYNEGISNYNSSVYNWEREQEKRTDKIDSCHESLSKLVDLGYSGSQVFDWILELPKAEEKHYFEKPIQKELIPEMPDQTELNSILSLISAAAAEEVHYNAYRERVEKQAQKNADISTLKAQESTLKDFRNEKLSKLETISGKIGGLEFNETGDFIFDNTTSSMLSDSQQMELSSKLSALYPEGLEIELIDRAESLGKSVLNLVNHAKSNDRNILVTVVGDKPAEIPEEIGVFVVEKGNIN